MKKLLLIGIMMILIVIPLMNAQKECERTMLITDIPCSIISSWQPGTCSDYNLTVYNQTGQNIINYTWKDYIPVCFINFTINHTGTYYYNSTIENGVITLVGDNNMIFIIFVPLALCFMFIFWGNSLREEQEPLKWFMRILSLVMVFLTFGAANMIINLNPGYEGLQAIFDFLIIQVIFYTIVAVVLMYLLIKVFMSFKGKKQRDFEEGIIR